MRNVVNALNNPKILTVLLSVLYVATVALAFAVLSASGADAGDRTYRSGEAIDEMLGAKHVSAVFIQEAATCKVNLVIEDAAPVHRETSMNSAARLRVTLHTGDAVLIDSADNEAMEVSCGYAGQAMAVGRGLATTVLASD